MNTHLRLLSALLVALSACNPVVERHGFRPVAPSSRLADLTGEGERLYWAGELDSARGLFTQVLEEARLAGDSTAIARALTWSGLTAMRSGHLADANVQGRIALDLADRLEDPREAFRATNLLGLVAYLQGSLRLADSLYRLAAALAERSGDDHGMAIAAGNLALVQLDLGDYPAARERLEMMQATALRLGEHRLQANALTDLASVDLLEGQLAQARHRLTAARGLYQDVGYPLGEVNALTQLATVFAQTGQYPAAIAAADSATVLAADRGFVQQEAAALSVLAEILTELGNDLQALRLLDSAQRLNAMLDLVIEQGTGLRRSAMILDRLGRPAAATEAAHSALRLHSTAGATPQVFADLLVLAGINREGSNRWLASARTIAESLGTRPARFDLALASARAYLDRGESEKALGILRPLAGEARSGDPAEEWQIADLRAEAYHALGRLTEAEEAARTAVASLDRVRLGLQFDWALTTAGDAALATRNRLVEILLERGEVGPALAAADGINSTGWQGPHAPESGGQDDREALLRSIAGLAQQVRTAETADKMVSPELRNRLIDSRDAYERLLLTASAALQGPTLPQSGAGIQSMLADDEALAVYFVGPEHVHLFFATRTHLTHYLIPEGAEALERRVRLARDLIARPDLPTAFEPVAERLAELLLPPAVVAPDGRWPRRLVLVAPGYLGRLPFAALRYSTTGLYLAETTEISTAPSAARLAYVRAHPAPAERTTRVTAFAPDPDDLPWSGREARRVAELGRGGRSIVGAAASEERFRVEAGQSDVIHISAHAALNADNPLFSVIELRGTGPEPSQDGLLETHEVRELAMRAHLVFLSGCETALTRRAGGPAMSSGSEVATLATAFMQAGSSSVIATLWKIPDQSTTALVEAFYHGLEGQSPGSALAHAQREMLRRPATSHPYNWAAFVLLGGSS